MIFIKYNGQWYESDFGSIHNIPRTFLFKDIELLVDTDLKEMVRPYGAFHGELSDEAIMLEIWLGKPLPMFDLDAILDDTVIGTKGNSKLWEE